MIRMESREDFQRLSSSMMFRFPLGFVLLMHFSVYVFMLSSSEYFKLKKKGSPWHITILLNLPKFIRPPIAIQVPTITINATNLIASRDTRCFNRLLWDDYDNIFKEITKVRRRKFVEWLLRPESSELIFEEKRICTVLHVTWAVFYQLRKVTRKVGFDERKLCGIFMSCRLRIFLLKLRCDEDFLKAITNFEEKAI